MSRIRKTASEIAHGALYGDLDVEHAIDAFLRRMRPEVQRCRFFRSLAGETVRRAGTLDAILSSYSTVPLVKLDPHTLSALRTAVCEITFSSDAAPHAAIESARQIAKYADSQAVPIVDNTLRSVASGISPVLSERPSKQDLKKTVPKGHGAWRRFDRDVLPDPGKKTDYLAARHSFPGWFVARLLAQYGGTAERILEACNEPAHVAIMANSLKTDRDRLAQLLANRGIVTEPGADGQSLFIRDRWDLADIPAYARGLFQICRASDIAAVRHLAPLPGERICILGGNPETGALISQLAGTGGLVTAVLDRVEDADRAAREKRRLGLANLHFVVAAIEDITSVLNASFDRVLVSPRGTDMSMLRQHPGARWRMKEENLTELTAGQELALTTGIDLCAAGGIVVYATASLLDEENGRLVDSVVPEFSYMRLIDSRAQLPSLRGEDGGFTAKIAKLSLF
jgi:16S rRNA (cytosine967-C5)-methyltransferase